MVSISPELGSSFFCISAVWHPPPPFSSPAPCQDSRWGGSGCVLCRRRDIKYWHSRQISIHTENAGCLWRREAGISLFFIWQLTRHLLLVFFARLFVCFLSQSLYEERRGEILNLYEEVIMLIPTDTLKKSLPVSGYFKLHALRFLAPAPALRRGQWPPCIQRGSWSDSMSPVTQGWLVKTWISHLLPHTEAPRWEKAEPQEQALQKTAQLCQQQPSMQTALVLAKSCSAPLQRMEVSQL